MHKKKIRQKIANAKVAKYSSEIRNLPVNAALESHDNSSNLASKPKESSSKQVSSSDSKSASQKCSKEVQQKASQPKSFETSFSTTPKTRKDDPSLVFAIILLNRFCPEVYNCQTDHYLAGVRRQLFTSFSIPEAEKTLATFASVLKVGQAEIRRGNERRLEAIFDLVRTLFDHHLDLHGGFVLLTLYEFLLMAAHQSLSGCTGSPVDCGQLKARLFAFVMASEGMPEAMLKLSDPRFTFAYLGEDGRSMLVLTKTGNFEQEIGRSVAGRVHSTTESFLLAEKKAAKEAFGPGSTSCQKKFALLCAEGDKPSNKGIVDGFCKALKKSSIFSKKQDEQLSPSLQPQSSQPSKSAFSIKTDSMAGDEKGRKIMDFLAEVRSVDEAIFQATVGIFLANQGNPDQLLFLAIYHQLMSLYRVHCPPLQTVYWRHFGWIHLHYLDNGDCSVQLLGERETSIKGGAGDGGGDKRDLMAIDHANCGHSAKNEIRIQVLTSSLASSGRPVYAIRQCELCRDPFSEALSTDKEVIIKTKVILPPNPSEYIDDFSSTTEVDEEFAKEMPQISAGVSKKKSKKYKRKKKSKSNSTSKSIGQLSNRLQSVLDLSNSD